MSRLIAPDNLPIDFLCRQILIPNDPHIIAAVNGALSFLNDPERWEQLDPLGPDEETIAELMTDMYHEYLISECGGGGMEAVYAQMKAAPATTINNNVKTRIPFQTVYLDSHNGCITGALAKFVIPAEQSGVYFCRCIAGLAAQSGWAVGETFEIWLGVNGVYAYLLHKQNAPVVSAQAYGQGSMLIPVVAGQDISFAVYQNNGANIALMTDASVCACDIFKVADT